MTLIVAQIIQNQVQILSDTQITHQSLGPLNPLEGRLKTVILNPFTSISFSGQPFFAERVIKALYKKEHNNILIGALEANIMSEDSTHFIICMLKENVPKLFVIRNKNVERNVKSAYIGDAFAYKKYRSFYEASSKTEIFEKMIDGFDSVIDDESNETATVGQFMTKVTTELASNISLNFLGYQVNMLHIVGKQKFAKSMLDMDLIKNANASEGGYSYTYLRGFNPQNPAFAIHFHVGSFGILFYPLIDYVYKDKCNPTIFLNEPDGEKFALAIREKFKLEMQGLVISEDGNSYKHIITE